MHRKASPSFRHLAAHLARCVAAAGLAALSACGGGGGGDAGGPPEPPPDPLFTDARAYGSSTLPAGATAMSTAEFKTWAGSDTLVWVTQAEAQAAVAARAARQAADQALVDAAAAASPAIARQLQMARQGADLVVRPDGTRVLTLDDPGERVMLMGPQETVADIAASLRMTNARANVEATYRELYPLVPEDQRTGLPDPAALGAVGDAELQRARADLARRVEAFQPSEDVPALPWEQPAAAGSTPAPARAPGLQALGVRRIAATDYETQTRCDARLNSWATDYNWSLKGHITPTRAQGERGTCAAHGIVAGIETHVKRWRGRSLDLSEQELYAKAKYDWDRTSDDYGDGLPTGDILEHIRATAYRIDNESQWRYNPSSSRLDDPDQRKYSNSCAGYAGPCSNTNHQRPIVCTTVNQQTHCAYKLPDSVTNPASDNQRLTSYASLWDGMAPEDSLATVRAMVAAGKPVVIAVHADQALKDAGTYNAEHGLTRGRGRVLYDPDSEVKGGHAMLVVGYLNNGSLMAQDRDDSGGYLVIKNSWDCKGDLGYFYAPYSWVIDRTKGAWAITGVASSTNPSFTLSLSKAVAQGPADMRFTVNGNVGYRKIAYYRAGESSPFYTWNNDGNLPLRTGPTTYADLTPHQFDTQWAEGPNFVVAQVTDEGGTLVATNWVTVVKDSLPPVVTLQASAATVTAPGDVVFTATASDASGVAKVEFFRGFTRIGTVTAPPYRLTYHFNALDYGSMPYVAMATDSLGHKRVSAPVQVTSLGLVRPIIGSFGATPDTLAAPGGTATLSWAVLGAASVSIDHGVGTQPAVGSTTVSLAASTVYTLTATNSAGTTTGQATVVVQAVLAPQVQSFTATPATLPLGGGNVTLAWTFLGTAPDTVSISPAVGNVTGLASKVVNVATSTTYTLSATNAGGTRTRTVTVEVAGDTTAPTVSLAAAPAALASAGSVKLSATASDNVGVTRVEFWRGATLLGQATSAPYALDVPLTAADNGSVAFTAKAYDAAGNSASSAAATVSVAIPLPDTTPPTVGLAASAVNVTTPGSTTLSATAADNVGLAAVEFYEGATLLATRLAPPYTLDIAYGAAEVGTHAYTARAVDTSGNSATSAALSVVVSLPVTGDRHVDPVAGSDGNDGLSVATAYKTITKAVSTVAAGGTVWLAGGSYPPENIGAPSPASLVAVPAGITVRALTDGTPQLGFGLGYAAGGSAIGLVFNGPGVRSDLTGIDATGGTVVLRNLRFANLGNANAGPGGFGAQAGLKVHGTAVVTLDNDVADALVFGAGVENAALVFDTGKLTITGGRIESSGGCFNDACVAQMKTGGSAELTLDGMQLALSAGGSFTPQPLLLLAGSSTATVKNSTLTQAGGALGYRDFAIANETATLAITASTVATTFHSLAGVQNGTPNIRLTHLTVAAAFTGKPVGATYFSLGASPNVTVVGGSYANYAPAGSTAVIDLDAGGRLLVVGATFTNNKNAIRLAGTGTYDFRLRSSSFAGNATCARPGCYTVSMAGSAASVFDLGTAADPGGNTFTAAAAGTGVLVAANAAVTVSAVGNTWTAAAQGADGAGRYNLGTAPCTANACSVGTGSGVNYVVNSGALKLAGP